MTDERRNAGQDAKPSVHEIPIEGVGDEVAAMLDVYRRVMEVHEPTQHNYEAVMQANQPINGFSTSSNW